jgi:hypothetical protein
MIARHQALKAKAMSSESDACRNCGCAHWRRPFKRRDCCGKCFYLFEYLRVVERWDLAQPETLRQTGALARRIGGNALPPVHAMSAEDFAVFKASYLEQIRAALDLLRIREAKRRGDLPVDGSSIEHKLKDMLKLIQLRDKYERAASRLHGLASMLDHTFSPEQCRILYNLLDDIEEQTYGRVAEGYKALEAICQNKRTAPVGAPPVVPEREPCAAPDELAGDAWAYGPHDIVRRVQQGGRVSLLGRVVRVSKRLRGKEVAFRPTGREGLFDVLLRDEIIATLDVRTVGRDGRTIPPLPFAARARFAGAGRAEMAPPTP